MLSYRRENALQGAL